MSEPIYIILLFLYWAFGCFFLIRIWIRDFDLDLATLIYITTIIWIPWIFIFLARANEIVVLKKRGE